ncbi:hypothetical protein BH24GEM1_BH24GEM1_15370 [soil metagenome]
MGRAVAALAADAETARWNGRSVSSGELAKVYGVRDLDGSQPDCWRYMREVVDAGRPADAMGYRPPSLRVRRAVTMLGTRFSLPSATRFL